MTTTTNNVHELAPLAFDGAWIAETRDTVTDQFDCGLCLDFGYLDGLGPCPRCDPDGYAEHAYYVAQERRSGLDGVDPWQDTRQGRNVVWGLA